MIRRGDVPTLYSEATLDQFAAKTRDVLRQWLEQPEGLVTITGRPGSGKTHCAWAVVREYQREHDGARFELSTAFLLDVAAWVGAYGMGGAVPALKQAARFPGLFVLDDLGAEKLTDFGQQSLIYLLTEREQWRRPTLVTSNLSLSEVSGRLDARIASRLAGGLVLVMQRDRRVKAQGG